MFIVTTIILNPIGCTVVTTIILHPIGSVIIVDVGGGWSRGVPKRRWSDTDVSVVILTHLLLFLRVADDDDVAIIEQP
jgi:hypothetical protein